uniref:TatA n=1 Tax=Cryptomonas curvata TaxID=233186 RepID=A0A2P1G8G2_9CRYP|nr:tatA [Cryptomonas curvata]AVM81229.1 tatA [Cryptomonas curvata]
MNIGFTQIIFVIFICFLLFGNIRNIFSNLKILSDKFKEFLNINK